MGLKAIFGTRPWRIIYAVYSQGAYLVEVALKIIDSGQSALFSLYVPIFQYMAHHTYHQGLMWAGGLHQISAPSLHGVGDITRAQTSPTGP